MKNLIFKPAFLLVVVMLSLVNAGAQKLTVEEVIAKHLESIGTKEKRASIKNQFIFSDLRFNIKGGVTPGAGKAVLLSEGNKNLWGFNLNLNDYQQDRFGFDGKETKIGFIRPGVRSVLGGFIFANKELLKDGLLGGTLFSSWALLKTDDNKSRIVYEGTKKIDARETHILSYSPKGGSDLSIKMYFDAENYRHLRTEYNQVISARQGGSVDSSASQTSDYYKLTENFSDFAQVSGVTIPKTYKIFYSYTGSSAAKPNREMEWTFNVTNFSLNQELDKNSFDIDAK